ncbi:hypothetical protein PRIPAC_84166 [Pristionchus pacificus]|uniref:Uncharacterized protein n=1 Tax=Pristionchus pacificus TaxID=54126 RepID=A0A2A6BML4_PRIPA|nr:hypothetical protein PRIPAC_84166 [Pristionchus pacificus]|eukprot:PDM67164.1 hypothetical protein PRIPAC_48581 [Pristionchus pacificus]
MNGIVKEIIPDRAAAPNYVEGLKIGFEVRRLQPTGAAARSGMISGTIPFIGCLYAFLLFGIDVVNVNDIDDIGNIDVIND